jgi:hypothetical protein
MAKDHEPQTGQLSMGDNYEEPDPWRDTGGGDRMALRKSREKEEINEILHKFGEYTVELGVGFEVQKNGDRFGTGMLHSVELLADLAGDDYEGDIEQFASQTYGQHNGFKVYTGERAARVRILEARRSINSLGYLANCIARVGSNMSAKDVVHELTRIHPSVLEEDARGEALVEDITRDAKILIGLLGPSGPQEIQDYITKLRFRIYAASRRPMHSDFTGFKKMTSSRPSEPGAHYADDAWRRFFEHTVVESTDDSGIPA